jgi:hypothetical protein
MLIKIKEKFQTIINTYEKKLKKNLILKILLIE